jgi:N-acetylated-alpha-linked acidic dipeptidase
MRLYPASLLLLLTVPALSAQAPAATQSQVAPWPIPRVIGYRNFDAQEQIDKTFLAVPDAKLAAEHLKILTAEPHWASSPEDYKTAVYVADKFKAAGLQTEIVPYSVWLNKPVKIEIEAFANGKKIMSGPTPEHVDPKAYGGDPFQDDKRILPAFNGSSPSGDITADVVFANYGTLADFDKLQQLGISVKGKIVIVKYGGNFRGVKVYIAQQRGAAGVLIYSDPADDGYARGDMYPRGPMRPASAVQRGSVQFLPIYAGDPTTPGVASTPDLPQSDRVMDPAKMNQPSIPANPLSYKDAAPILEALDGPVSPHDWQGGLPFTYHLGGTGAVKVHMDLVQDYKLRTIWDVIGTIPGEDTSAWVLAGNHRDAWVYGAVDPNSGTAAMLETVHGLGVLLKQGWKPKRTIIFGSWDAEEEGLIGSTEWVEAHAAQLSHAVAYFNTDTAVFGPNFSADAEPTLQLFVRQATTEVPSPFGGTVYDQWIKTQRAASPDPDKVYYTNVGNLGSGSDFTPFFQHIGVPSTDIASSGPYGVYHSTFDDYTWFVKNVDHGFELEQQQARVLGIEVLHMADAEILPYDYNLYGHNMVDYVLKASRHATEKKVDINISAALEAAQRFGFNGERIYALQIGAINPTPLPEVNEKLREAETALLSPEGLPGRTWYKQIIFAPGEYTGYEAVILPGINEAIDANDKVRAQAQVDILTAALNRASDILQSIVKH